MGVRFTIGLVRERVRVGNGEREELWVELEGGGRKRGKLVR